MIQYKPLLPDIEPFYAGIQQIWATKQLTNHGTNVRELEQRLSQELEVPYVSVVSSGTMAIMLAGKVLGLSGEVITSSLTFPGVIGALKWIGLEPVLCPTKDGSLNLDTSRIESLINEHTSAILALHLFGIPCDIDQIQSIASKHKLSIIYDASHCFGVRIDSKGIGNFGDITIFSLHATKIFHCIEGGILAYQNKEYQKSIALLRNFGILDENLVAEESEGLNGKMSEIHALMGLCLLEPYKAEITKRHQLMDVYFSLLQEIPDINLFPLSNPRIEYNYSYMPILLTEEFSVRDKVCHKLLEEGIWAKKFFFNENILLLPLHGGMDRRDVVNVCLVLRKIL